VPSCRLSVLLGHLDGVGGGCERVFVDVGEQKAAETHGKVVAWPSPRLRHPDAPEPCVKLDRDQSQRPVSHLTRGYPAGNPRPAGMVVHGRRKRSVLEDD
jgi:hypothetical protein